MYERPITIAIDGYSSTGKSSFAKNIASAYGLTYLDSGALYRCVTLYAIEKSMIHDGVPDRKVINQSLSNLKLEFVAGRGVVMNGCNVEERIRMMDVSSNVSQVAALACVRDYVDEILRSYGDQGGIIMDGRDIGTTVFPQADLKIFMVADMEVRARRRTKELEAKGTPTPLEDVMKNLEERDKMDATRAVSPLRQAQDAIVLDNSRMTMEDQMVWIADIMRTRFGIVQRPSFF